MSVHRQVDYGAGPFDFGRTAFELRLLLLDGLGQEARVEVEPDRGHVSVLLRAQDVAGAANLQIRQGDLEPGPELRGVEDGLQSLAGDVRERLAAPVQQIGVGAPRRPPDTAAELVELGQAKRVGSVDDDRVGVRDVQAGLDDRCADQHVGGAAGEGEHHLLELAFRHLAVAHRDSNARQQRPKLLGLRLDRLDAVVDEEDLTAAVQLAQDGVADEPGGRLGDPCLDRQPVLRRRLDQRQVADAGERQVERPRDRCRGQRQHVDLAAQLLEPLLGGHSETLLLVHDDHAQVAEPDVLAQQAMRADDEIDRA